MFPTKEYERTRTEVLIETFIRKQLRLKAHTVTKVEESDDCMLKPEKLRFHVRPFGRERGHPKLDQFGKCDPPLKDTVKEMHEVVPLFRQRQREPVDEHPSMQRPKLGCAIAQRCSTLVLAVTVPFSPELRDRVIRSKIPK